MKADAISFNVERYRPSEALEELTELGQIWNIVGQKS